MGLGNRNIATNGFRANRVAAPRTPAASALETQARQLADQLFREREFARRRVRNGRTYTSFDPVDDVLPNNIETITKGLFSGNTGSLLNFYTQSSATAIQNTYYRTVYNGVSSTVTSQPQFSIAYGHYNGSGSADLTGNLNDDTPSRAIYKQYAQLLLQPLDKKFTINGQDTDSIYVINFNRARFREKIDPGNLEINLGVLSGSAFANNVHTGSNVRINSLINQVVSLIDDSSLSAAAVGESGRIYNIVSGTIDDGTVFYPNSAALQYYGLLYPEAGVAILDATKLDLSASFNTVTGSGVQGDNAMKLFTSISGSVPISAPSGKNYGLQARSSEQVKSTYYFVRVKNGDYNYSNNPSFVSGSNGDLAFTTFINNPQTYITSVGLYNDRRELLAVAKMSQPILKSFTREVLIKVKLDF